MERFRDLGCGILTILLITLPVWVLTTGWRGPGYAVRSLVLIGAAVVVMVMVNRVVERRGRKP